MGQVMVESNINLTFGLGSETNTFIAEGFWQ